MLNGMKIKESVNDSHILKAVFFAGGPGSGKSYIAANMFAEGSIKNPFLGVKVINSDDLFELGLTRAHLSKILDIKNKNIYKMHMEIREWAKKLSETRKGFYINSLLPIVIDGTGKNYKKIVEQAYLLKLIGYDVSMVFVNTTLKVALERNALRPRKLDNALVEKMWKEVQGNLEKFQRYFGKENFIIINNNDSFEPESEDARLFALNLYRSGRRLLNQPLKNPMGKANYKLLRDLGKKYLSELPARPILSERKLKYINIKSLKKYNY